MAKQNKGWSGRKTLLVLACVFGLPLAVLWALGQTEMLKALGVFLLLIVGSGAFLLLCASQLQHRLGVDWGEFWRHTFWQFWR